MKSIKLNTLTLQNFKGIKDFTLTLEGNNVAVFGDNATGKTTLADAFIWLLFDKDTQNKKDFGIKRLENGQEIHNLEHSVEGAFIVAGESLNLKKVYKEKWTKKRGHKTAEFSGHETDHYVDEVPVSKREYTDKVNSLIDEDVFKLITSPSYFNEQIKWQDRRKTLLEICGDIDEDEVFNSSTELKALPLILKGKSVDDFKKIVAEKRRKINSELDMIPVRVSEVENSLHDLDGTPAELSKELEGINSQIEENETIIRNIKNGQAIQDKQNELKNVEHEINMYKREFSLTSQDLLNRLKVKKQEIEGNISILKRKIFDVEHDVSRFQSLINSLDNTMNKLRDEYKELSAKQFESHNAATCPTCKQSLPAEEVEKAHAEALAQFNERKSIRLAEIQTEGKKLATEKLGHEGHIESYNVDLKNHQEKMEEHMKALKKVESEIETTQQAVPVIDQDETYLALMKKREELQQFIKDLQESAMESINEVQEELSHLKAQKFAVEKLLAAHSQSEKAKERITELEEKQTQLAQEYEKLEHHLHLTEQFTRAKVNLLEEKINDKFKFARFKLFNQQINGGLEETCETLFEGIPYGAGLNNAARINIGIDIINTLTEYYGIRAPIFIDNAESVTRLIDSDSQLVSLVVSEPDKDLRVEVEI